LLGLRVNYRLFNIGNSLSSDSAATVNRLGGVDYGLFYNNVRVVLMVGSRLTYDV